MANRFWVGGGSANTWAATANTNWAATSGGANNQTVPGASDLAIFDGGSGVGNSVIGANITVQGLDCTGGTGTYAGTITHNSGVTLTINTGAASSLRLTSGMAYTPASTTANITFTNTTGTAQITSAGKTFAAITVNGSGGTVQQQDNISINAVANSQLILTTGIYDCNGFSLTAIVVSGSNSNTRSLLLGSGVTLGGNVSAGTAIWNFSTTTLLTFTKNSANITVLAPTSPIQSVSFGGGGLTYNGLTLSNTTNNTQFSLTGANTFATFGIGNGWDILLPSNTTTTITAAPTWAGTQNNPILIGNFGNIAQTSTLSVPSGAVTLNWGALYSVVGAGGATFTATNTFNFGTVSGWSITPPGDATTAGIASSLWRDTTAGDFTVAGSIGQALFNSTGLTTTLDAVPQGIVTTGASTTSVPTSALSIKGSAASGVVANQFAGGTILFAGNTTTAGLRGTKATISASSASNTPTLTVGVLPATPVSGDTFSII